MNISRLLSVICTSIFYFVSMPSVAALVDNGGGFIYDTVLDITWSQPEEPPTHWDHAVIWAAGLTLNGVSGWRLPYISVAAGVGPLQAPGPVYCESATELACRDNELGYMFYHNLSGTKGQSILTSGDPDLALFPTLQSSPYWSGTWYGISGFDELAWGLSFDIGITFFDDTILPKSTWAVHDGNVIPVIVIEKLTNGNQADHARDQDVPIIAQGDPVNWTYEVTNTTATALSESEIVVTDSQPGVVPVLDTASDTGGDLILSPGETWVYTATAQALDLEFPPPGVTVVRGCSDWRYTYENTGRAEIFGTGLFDEDSSHYCNPKVGVPGQGTWEATLQGRNLDSDATTFEAYYDTALDITWLADANAYGTSMEWAEANTWAASLNIGGVTGWRLPTVSPVNDSTFNLTMTTNATSDIGYAPTTTDGTDGGWRDGTGAPVSEMGHMFYVTLGNLGECPPDGGDGDPSTCDGRLLTGYGVTNIGPFSNLQLISGYWTGMKSSASIYFYFSTGSGTQSRTGLYANMYAWAVHDGDVGDISALIFEKLTNGNQADGPNDADVPQIAQGDPVNWTYEVTNTTATALSESEIVVTDSQPGVVPVLDTASDTGGDLILSPGETWVYTATAQALDLEFPPPGVTVVQGCGYMRNTYENTGRAEIVGVGVIDEDLSHYCNPFDPTVDSDNDGMPDLFDNCILKPNGPLILDAGGNFQRDTDGDQYGNICDADLNNDGIVNLSDYSAFRAAFGGAAPLTPPQENADFNGDGTVNLSDYSIFRSSFGKAPGPSFCCAP